MTRRFPRGGWALGGLSLLAVLLPRPLAAAGSGGITVEGRLSAGSGLDLQQARVELVPLARRLERDEQELLGTADGKPVAEARCGPGGRYRLSAPSAGLWKVVIRLPGAVTMEHRLVPLVQDRVLPPLTLAPARPLEVRVTDAAGRPVADARIRAVQRAVEPAAPSGSALTGLAGNWAPALLLARTGPDGRGVLAGGGDLLIEAVAAGHPLVEAAVADRSSIELRLPDGWDVALRVRHGNGTPALGAVVRIGSQGRPVALTDRSGLANITVAETGLQMLDVEAPGGGRRWGELAPAGGETREVAWVLPEPFNTSGRVIDARTHEGIAGALVWADDVSGMQARTSPRGSYHLGLPSPAGSDLLVAAAGYLPARVPPVVPGRGGAEVLLQPAVLLRGRVVDGQGRPVGDAEVRSRVVAGRRSTAREIATSGDSETRSDGGGAFTLGPLLPTAVHRIEARAEGFAPRSRVISPGDGVPPLLTFVLTAGRTLQGRVVDGEDRPTPGAVVRLVESPLEAAEAARILRVSGPAIGYSARATTDEDGWFALPAVPPGRYGLTAGTPDLPPLTVPGIVVTEGAEPMDVGTLVLLPGVALRGKVVDPEGAPVAGAHVRATPLATPEVELTARTDTEGLFTLDALRPGERLSVVVEEISGERDELLPGPKVLVTVPETPGDGDLIVLELTPGSRIFGRVAPSRLPASSPAPSASSPS
ncbi:MAG: carboxypeptidase regulatory-like domain-containing protein, partial [Acidobacteria bacterium]|nr:carboxypeptidase regulatory-like domain-containing protein [Acidobacteriota bacterium]